MTPAIAPVVDVTRVGAGELVAAITAQARAAGNPERAAGSKRYLHSELEFVGADVPTVRRIAVQVWREQALDRASLTELVRALWDSGVFECRLAAVELLVAGSAVLEPRDLGVVEALLRTADTWALVDPLATNVVGRLVVDYPAVLDVLDAWAADDDFWVRRTALLALLPEVRRGAGDFERFCRYADAMLDEREFFIRKAIGWVLREAGRTRPDEVLDWLAPRTGRASGVTMREAVKHLPAADAERLMAAYRRGEPAT